MTPRQRRKIRHAVRRPDVDPSEEGSELNIVPFLDIVVNLMLFMLATSAATMVMAEVDVTLPGACQSGCEGREALGLNVTLADRGVIVATRGGPVAAECRADGGGPSLTLPNDSVPNDAVPNDASGYDFDALAACLARLHERHPDEDGAVLTADPMVRYESLVGAMDALRESGFERVQLSAGPR